MGKLGPDVKSLLLLLVDHLGRLIEFEGTNGMSLSDGSKSFAILLLRGAVTNVNDPRTHAPAQQTLKALIHYREAIFMEDGSLEGVAEMPRDSSKIPVPSKPSAANLVPPNTHTYTHACVNDCPPI